jgi:hypothetical protein
VTEPGSSGSGIWNTNTNLLLGTLSGGGSACSSRFSPDCYGKFSIAWGSGTVAATRLRDWLDPQNTAVSSVAGSNPPVQPFIDGLGATLTAEGCSPANGVVDPGEVVTINVSLQNIGTAPTTNLVAALLATNGVLSPSSPQNYGALAINNSPVSRTFSFIASGSCGGAITPTLQLQDGTLNLGTVNFRFIQGVPIVTATQHFDTVGAPALPSGWTTSPSGAWTTTTSQNDTPPNAAFASDPASVSDRQLISPVFPVSGVGGLSFQHSYDFEAGYDGGVLEISTNGSVFVDILAVGGTFITGGYNAAVPSGYGNPLSDRAVWSGNSGGFVLTTVVLPTVAAGSNVQFRWRLGSDSSGSGTGWYVDTVSFSVGYACCAEAPPVTLTAPKYGPGKQFQFNVIGGTGFAYTILAASNLSGAVWVPLATNTAPFSFTDLNAVAFPSRFYRARSQ